MLVFGICHLAHGIHRWRAVRSTEAQGTHGCSAGANCTTTKVLNRVQALHFELELQPKPSGDWYTGYLNLD